MSESVAIPSDLRRPHHFVVATREDDAYCVVVVDQDGRPGPCQLRVFA